MTIIPLETCIREALNQPELLEQFDRLNETHLSKRRSPLEQMIDEATGYPGFSEKEMRHFFDFVRDYVWKPLNFPSLK